LHSFVILMVFRWSLLKRNLSPLTFPCYNSNMQTTSNRQKKLAMIALIISVIIGGATGVFTKIVVVQIPPFTLTFLRFIFALLFMLPFFLKEKPQLFNKNAIPLFLISFLSTINIILFAIGVQWTSAITAQLIQVSIPILVALFSFFLYQERLTGKKISGMMIGFIGVCIVILLPVIEHGVTITSSLIGNIFIFIGVICYALYTVFSKKLHVKKFSFLTITIFFAFTAILTSLPFSLYESTTNLWWDHLSTYIVWLLIILGFFGSFIWYFLYQYIIKHGSPLIGSMQFFLLPISNFIWAYFLLGEKLTTGFVIGAIFAFIGVYLTISSPAKTS